MSKNLLLATKSLREALGDFEPALYSGEDCVRLVEDLALTEKVCAAALARAGARAAECGAHRAKGYRDASDWLAKQTGQSPGQARSELNTAKALDDLPRTKEALENGELSLAQAGEIAKAVGECPGVEAELLKTAREEPLPRLKDRARRMRQRAMDEAELQRKRIEAQSFRSWEDEMGMTCFMGKLLPEVGIPFLAKLDAETDRVWRASSEEARKQPRERLAAQAFARVVAGNGKGHATRADLVLVCDLEAFRRGHTEGGEPCHVVGGPEVPVSVARGMAQDAFLKVVLHDGKKIDTIAHYGRHVPAEVRTALDLGDPPGFEGPKCVDCGRRYHLQDDHVDPRANRGLTSYDNLSPRCPPCHREKTERDRSAGLLGNRNGSRGNRKQREKRQRVSAGAGDGRREPP